MTQSTMTNPSTSTAYDPYETIDTSSLESLSFDDDASSKSSEPQYKLTIDENVVEKISSLAAQKVEDVYKRQGEGGSPRSGYSAFSYRTTAVGPRLP